MIVFFEPQCVDWQHEMVNAGLIELIYCCYPNEKILFLCERKQGQNINKLVVHRNPKISIDYMYFDMPDGIKDDYQLTGVYIDLINSVIKRYGDKINTFILTSSHRGNMQACLECARINNNIHFIVVVHAIMESVLKRHTWVEWKKGKDLLRTIRNLAEQGNIDFITYSPLLQKRLHRKLKNRYVEKFYFIHHPYQFNAETDNCADLKTNMNYGIVGACNNEYAKDIVEKVIVDRTIECNFIIMASDLIQEKDSRITIVENGQRVGREEMLKYFKELSYFLIPYRRNQYMISASGVFWDAVNEEIPIIILDCPYTRYYNEKYDIGWQFDTTEEIISFMKKGINCKDPVWLEKQSNIRKMKKKVVEENFNKVKTLIGEK